MHATTFILHMRISDRDPAATKRKMAISSDIMTSLRGKPWSSWTDQFGSESSCSEDEDNLVRDRKPQADVMKLPKQDMILFGFCPEQDDFYVVTCELCGKIVKPQGLTHHMELRHKPDRLKIVDSGEKNVTARPGTKVKSKKNQQTVSTKSELTSQCIPEKTTGSVPPQTVVCSVTATKMPPTDKLPGSIPVVIQNSVQPPQPTPSALSPMPAPSLVTKSSPLVGSTAAVVTTAVITPTISGGARNCSLRIFTTKAQTPTVSAPCRVTTPNSVAGILPVMQPLTIDVSGGGILTDSQSSNKKRSDRKENCINSNKQYFVLNSEACKQCALFESCRAHSCQKRKVGPGRRNAPENCEVISGLDSEVKNVLTVDNNSDILKVTTNSFSCRVSPTQLSPKQKTKATIPRSPRGASPYPMCLPDLDLEPFDCSLAPPSRPSLTPVMRLGPGASHCPRPPEQLLQPAPVTNDSVVCRDSLLDVSSSGHPKPASVNFGNNPTVGATCKPSRKLNEARRLLQDAVNTSHNQILLSSGASNPIPPSIINSTFKSPLSSLSGKSSIQNSLTRLTYGASKSHIQILPSMTGKINVPVSSNKLTLSQLSNLSSLSGKFNVSQISHNPSNLKTVLPKPVVAAKQIVKPNSVAATKETQVPLKNGQFHIPNILSASLKRHNESLKNSGAKRVKRKNATNPAEIFSSILSRKTNNTSNQSNHVPLVAVSIPNGLPQQMHNLAVASQTGVEVIVPKTDASIDTVSGLNISGLGVSSLDSKSELLKKTVYNSRLQPGSVMVPEVLGGNLVTELPTGIASTSVATLTGSGLQSDQIIGTTAGTTNVKVPIPHLKPRKRQPVFNVTPGNLLHLPANMVVTPINMALTSENMDVTPPVFVKNQNIVIIHSSNRFVGDNCSTVVLPKEVRADVSQNIPNVRIATPSTVQVATAPSTVQVATPQITYLTTSGPVTFQQIPVLSSQVLSQIQLQPKTGSNTSTSIPLKLLSQGQTVSLAGRTMVVQQDKEDS